MVEPAVDTPVTPENLKLKGGPTRSNSIGDFRTSNSGVKVRARYLNASFGSCHDFCKYGGKSLHKESGSSFTLKHTKKLAMQSKPLPNSSNRIPNETRVPREKTNGSFRSAKRSGDLTSKSSIQRSSSLLTPGNTDIKKDSDVILSKGVGVLQVSPTGALIKGKKKEPVVSIIPQSARPSVKKELSAKSRISDNPKGPSRIKRHVNVGKAEPKQSLSEKVSEKMFDVVETKAEESSQSLASISEEKKMGSDENKIQSSKRTPSSENKKGRHKSAGSFTVGLSLNSRKKSSGLKGDENVPLEITEGVKSNPGCEESGTKKEKPLVENKTEGKNRPKQRVKVGVEEKTESTCKLNFKRGKVIGVESKNTTPTRLQFKPRKVIVDNLKKVVIYEGSASSTNLVKQVPKHKVEINNRPKRVGKFGLEEKKESTYKLDFERGKVIDVQSKYTPPRRLKFKPRRALAENLDGKADKGRRNLKKLVDLNEVNGLKTNSLKVVLKHQTVEGKKDVQILLNNVIEETATRLVRMRKSKVKALVGAFESLMSLPDASSSSITAS